MLANVGAFPRDPMDQRLLAAVRAGTIVESDISVNPANDALRTAFTGSPPAAPADTDNDGMPDDWELEVGLDPGSSDTNGSELSIPMTGVAGYTNLECYLYELANRRVAEGM